MKKEEQEKIRCSKCNSTQTHLRLKTKERVCNTCGYIEKLGVKNG